MKVQKSSKECAVRNEAVKAEIELGLSEAWEPSDEIIRQEAEAKKREEAGFKLAASKKEVLVAVGCTGVADGSRHGRAGDVRVEIDDVRAASGRWSSGYISGWRLYIGDRYGSEKGSWVAIGDNADLGINDKQLAKAKAKIAEEQARINTKKAAAAVKQSVEQRTSAFIAANPEFVKLTGFSAFCSGESYYANWDKRTHYTTAAIVNEDGSVRMGSETFTVAQWVEIFNLRNAQSAAMKALKESFKTISPAS